MGNTPREGMRGILLRPKHAGLPRLLSAWAGSLTARPLKPSGVVHTVSSPRLSSLGLLWCAPPEYHCKHSRPCLGSGGCGILLAWSVYGLGVDLFSKQRPACMPTISHPPTARVGSRPNDCLLGFSHRRPQNSTQIKSKAMQSRESFDLLYFFFYIS